MRPVHASALVLAIIDDLDAWSFGSTVARS